MYAFPRFQPEVAAVKQESSGRTSRWGTRANSQTDLKSPRKYPPRTTPSRPLDEPSSPVHTSSRNTMHQRANSDPFRGRRASVTSLPSMRPPSRTHSVRSEISEYGPDGNLIKRKTITTSYSSEAVHSPPGGIFARLRNRKAGSYYDQAKTDETHGAEETASSTDAYATRKRASSTREDRPEWPSNSIDTHAPKQPVNSTEAYATQKRATSTREPRPGSLDQGASTRESRPGSLNLNGPLTGFKAMRLNCRPSRLKTTPGKTLTRPETMRRCTASELFN